MSYGLGHGLPPTPVIVVAPPPPPEPDPDEPGLILWLEADSGVITQDLEFKGKVI